MNFSFPKTKFVDENDSAAQFEHVVSEIAEVSMALDNNEPALRVDEELMDLFHSLESYFRIKSKENGPDYVADLRRFVFAKNAARGYYPCLGGKR